MTTICITQTTAVLAAIDIALATLADVAANGQSESVRVSAACAILDRTYGKPRPMPNSAKLEGLEYPSAPLSWSL